MTQQHRTALKELQKLDRMIHATRQRIQDFDPLFAEVEEPALVLEAELATSRNRIKEMKLEERRLERSSEEKRERIKRLDERLGSVRNLREEAAVSAELEMVKRSLQNDEQEAMSLIDQLRKGEERATELEAAHTLASSEVEPKKAQLLSDREQARGELASMQKERDGFAQGMDAAELRIYEAIRDGGRRTAVSELTEDGACGNCFGMVPPQHQNDVRHGASLIRCEACGVILAAAPVVAAEEPAVAVGAEVPTPEGADESGDDEGAGEEGE
jgi:predicted  nucleic acid-binding Zn-ribbon protein